MRRIKLLVWLFSALYLAVLGILWASPWWPSRLWWLATLFQMAPLWALYFPVGFLFITGLLVKGKRAIVINILSSIVLFFGIMGFNVSFSMLGQGNVKARDSLRIMTCSLGTNVNLSSLSEFIAETQPDIIALQDVHTKEQTALKRILDPDKWNLTFQKDLGLASRLEIRNVDVNNRRIFSRYGGLVTKYELEGAGGRINFFNVHLESPRKGLEAIIKKGLGGLLEIIRIRKLQEEESIIVSQWIKSHRQVLIAGDFNMRETNPAYKKYWSMFSDAFLKTGLGFGYTYYTRWHGIRIDRLLCGDDWRVIHSEVGPDIGSDHRPVVADVEFIGQQLRVEEAQEQAAIDSAALVSENFEMSLGGFEDFDCALMTIDSRTGISRGNALKIEPKAGLDYLSSGIKFDIWDFENYPIVSFSYRIPEEVRIRMRAKTIYDDWIALDKTRENGLIDDGKWHEIRINAGLIVKSALPALKYLTEFQFYTGEGSGQKDAFWIDDFKITRS